MKNKFSFWHLIFPLVFSFLVPSFAEEGAEPSFENPVSQLVTQSQFLSPMYEFFCAEMKEEPAMHRKQWEFCYIIQVLNSHGYLQPGKKGLGFGVGREPLPSLFAKYGCQIVATDQDSKSAVEKGWVQTGQFVSSLDALNERNICSRSEFSRLVTMRAVDMNKIDSDLKEFDFVWSSCALEHLGSLDAGIDFIINSLKCLKKGGVAIHTTEFNLSSNDATLASGGTVIYRKQDIEKLVRRVKELGYEILPVNFHPGSGELDRHVDLPPYKRSPHLKLKLDRFDSTSIGLVIFNKKD